MKIVGKNIRLRAITELDLQMKVNWINDPDVHKYLHYEIPLRLDKTIEWFQRVSKDNTRYDLIIETIESTPIGLIGLIGINKRYQSAEFYIAIGNKEYWGRGVGAEASSLIANWAFTSLELYKLWVTVRAENKAMIAMMTKIGYKIEGTLKEERVVDGKRVDIVRMGLLKKEFKFKEFK
jgi:RimJ/RimL family protein N-acetyltransferase